MYTKDYANTIFPDLEPFMMRRKELIERPEVMVVLNKYKEMVSTLLTSVAIEQHGDLVHLSADTEKISENSWNYFNVQCRGIILNVISERCIYFGMMHPLPSSLKLESDFPIDAFDNPVYKRIELLKPRLVGIYKAEDDICFCDEKSLKIPENNELLLFARKVYQFDTLDLSKYYHTFALYVTENAWELMYVAARSTVTLDLELEEISEEIALKLGMRHF